MLYLFRNLQEKGFSDMFGLGGGGKETKFLRNLGRKSDASRISGCLSRIHRSPIGVWERTGHSSNISSLQPKTMERIMMYSDVPSSKMHEERSNKVLNSSNGPFSLTFIEACQYQSTSACRFSCIASTYCGVTRKQLDFRNRHIKTHQFTPRLFFPNEMIFLRN